MRAHQIHCDLTISYSSLPGSNSDFGYLRLRRTGRFDFGYLRPRRTGRFDFGYRRPRRTDRFDFATRGLSDRWPWLGCCQMATLGGLLFWKVRPQCGSGEFGACSLVHRNDAGQPLQILLSKHRRSCPEVCSKREPKSARAIRT